MNLRWLKQQTKHGGYTLQMKADDGNWYDIPDEKGNIMTAQEICCDKATFLSYTSCPKHGALNYPVKMPPPEVKKESFVEGLVDELRDVPDESGIYREEKARKAINYLLDSIEHKELSDILTMFRWTLNTEDLAKSIKTFLHEKWLEE